MKNKIKKRKINCLAIAILFLATITFSMYSVQATAMYPQVEPGVQYTIGEFVFDDNFNPITDDCCNITIRYPSGAIYVEDVSMVNYSDGWHEYNVTLATPGFYRALMWCNCSDDYASIDKSFIVGPSFGMLNTSLNYINNTINYINNTYLPLLETKIDSIYSLCQQINNNVSNVTTDWNTLYVSVSEILNITTYLNGTIWAGHIASEITDVLNYINDTHWNGYNASDIYDIADLIENIVLNINTTTNSLGETFTVRLTDFGEINPGSDYLAQVTIFDSDGTMINADAAPVISLYDPSGNLIVNDVPMTWIGTGQYGYSYTTAGGQPSGQWTTITKTTVGGGIVKNIEYWELESNPPEVTLSVIDNCFSSIDAEISITNEGTGNQEYVYYWWITPRADGDFADVDTVDSSSASKLVAPLDTFTTVKTLGVPALGTYWYKTRVYWGTEWSAASAQFDVASCGGGGAGIVTPFPGLRKELTIKVVDNNWDPLQGVYVAVYDDGRLLGDDITNEEGVSLFSIPSMTIRVTASKNGYVPVETMIIVTSSTTEVIQLHPMGLGACPWILLILLIIGGIVAYYIYKRQKTGNMKKRTPLR